MTLDDVYGPEHDRFPLEQERRAAPPALEWSEIDHPQTVAGTSGRQRGCDPAATTRDAT